MDIFLLTFDNAKSVQMSKIVSLSSWLSIAQIVFASPFVTPCVGTQSLADLIVAILQRVGDEIDSNNLPQILVEYALHPACLFCFFISNSYAFEWPPFCSMKMKTRTRLYLHPIMIFKQQ